jgi:hypothetical protein
MQLVAPDILAEARGFPPAVLGTALAVGLFLWLLGARSHRFWIALVITLSAGLIGLSQGPAYGMQPLVAGLLLAIAAGALALSLVRVLLFAAGGFAALAVMHSLAPAYDEPLVSFLVGGLGGILLYRFWITTLTSLIGTLLIAYSGLCLLDWLRVVDAVAWSKQNSALLNWGSGAAAVVGILIQFLLERRRKRKAKALALEDAEDYEEERAPVRNRARRKSTWWGWGQKPGQRRAG